MNTRVCCWKICYQLQLTKTCPLGNQTRICEIHFLYFLSLIEGVAILPTYFEWSKATVVHSINNIYIYVAIIQNINSFSHKY